MTNRLPEADELPNLKATDMGWLTWGTCRQWSRLCRIPLSRKKPNGRPRKEVRDLVTEEYDDGDVKEHDRSLNYGSSQGHGIKRSADMQVQPQIWTRTLEGLYPMTTRQSKPNWKWSNDDYKINNNTTAAPKFLPRLAILFLTNKGRLPGIAEPTWGRSEPSHEACRQDSLFLANRTNQHTIYNDSDGRSQTKNYAYMICPSQQQTRQTTNGMDRLYWIITLDCHEH
jgi:hypothetical protein